MRRLTGMRATGMQRRIAVAGALALAFVLSAVLAGCSSAPTKPGTGFRTLDATVVSRDHEAPGTGGASFAGTGNYYLIFEARDAEATATFRFQVTKTQYDRYQEGSHVQIVLADNELRDIRPIQAH